ncbi:MAG: VTT domain-containing protein [Chloroflexi bacterium]|nr:VTT domain-containing protein [Chloroflexota bacterium]
MKEREPEQQDNQTKSFWNRDRALQLSSLLFVLLLVTILIWQKDNIREFAIVLAKYWGLKYLAIFLISLAASATLIIPIPGLAITSVIGAISISAWDPLFIGIASGIGASIGESTGYLLGYSGRMAIPDTKSYERVVGWMSKWGTLTIFLLALLPNPLFDLAGIAAGVLKYPIWKFILIGAAGRLPKHILFAYLGYWGIHIMPHN